ncbi:MAG: DNA polymerase I [Tepidanaerobacter acetatoxydans]|uniref:DNA polymerase I n=1 Tax=Tepidanaerobacter acetatoxydans TaxID=499229 RepID=UPI0026EDD061|nr:DNA polymerase I [Tepidanaerobacter acetatoxydans]NLU10099.1 DNA polymerase I [Tepidanaerobacter acetatoxydans]
MKKMLLIDGNSLLHRAFHALPPLRTSKGVHTNAVYGFLNMLFRILQEENPDYVTVAFDKKGPTFRHDEYAAYKATRPKTPDELIGQFDILKEILKALNINFIEADGFEADDILGTISKKGEQEGIFSIIVTGDKDALQLVSSKTNVLLTKKGISEMETYDLEKVKSRYGICPEAVADMKGLMGDKSDNIPGVPGVGEKTATKLIREFGTLDNVLKNTDKLKGRVKENLEKYAEQAEASKYLATIVRDVPLEFNPDDIAYCEPDYDKLINLFRDLEFYSLIDRVKIPANAIDTKEFDDNVTQNIENTDALQKLVKKINSTKNIAVLVDAEKKDLVSYAMDGIYISVEDKCYSISHKLLKENSSISYLKQILEDTAIYKITHDGKFTRNVLRQLGIDFRCQFDTMLAAYLLESSKPRYDIPILVMEYLGKTLADTSGFDEKTSYLFELKKIMDEKIKDYLMDKLFYEVEIPFSVVLADMEHAGIKVDFAKLQELSERFGKKLAALTEEIYDLAGTEFNINSPKQLGEILFEKLSLPVIKRTKTGYSTDAEVLEKLRPSHPIIEKILEYRFLMKMKSTYADGLSALVDKKTGRIYTSFNQTVTSTGRISSTEPNLQNIPVKTEEGKHIRGVFTADGPGHILLSGDYSQIELRVLAHMSQDPSLIEAFVKGEDIHKRTASEVFGVALEEVTPSLRDKAKAVNFGIIYGISDYGLAQNLGISNQEAKEYIDAYFARYPGVRDYIRETIKSAKTLGYVTTLLNRRRYIPDINSRNYHLRSFAERTAVNTPIQGSAADIIKIAMVKVYDNLRQNNLKAKILLQVHDELILDVPEEELIIVKGILKQHMENAIPLSVPLVVDFKQGFTWEEL